MSGIAACECGAGVIVSYTSAEVPNLSWKGGARCVLNRWAFAAENLCILSGRQVPWLLVWQHIVIIVAAFLFNAHVKDSTNTSRREYIEVGGGR